MNDSNLARLCGWVGGWVGGRTVQIPMFGEKGAVGLFKVGDRGPGLKEGLGHGEEGGTPCEVFIPGL